jgi:hypothetical protein
LRGFCVPDGAGSCRARAAVGNGSLHDERLFQHSVAGRPGHVPSRRDPLGLASIPRLPCQPPPSQRLDARSGFGGSIALRRLPEMRSTADDDRGPNAGEKSSTQAAARLEWLSADSYIAENVGYVRQHLPFSIFASPTSRRSVGVMGVSASGLERAVRVQGRPSGRPFPFVPHGNVVRNTHQPLTIKPQ